MGGMFRSEEMALCQLFIQPEAAYLSVSELGETGTVQFRDLNGDVNYFQRKFVNEVRRCDELERKLRYIEAEVRKDGVPIRDNLTELPRAPAPREIINLEAHLEKTENDIQELSQNGVNLKSNYLELMEFQHVLEKTQVFFTEEEANDSITKALINEEAPNPATSIRGHLEFVGGVINRERVPAFERMLWRISRGNVFLRQTEIDKPLEDPATGNEIYKTAFVAFFQGEQLKTRIKKVCIGFRASLYDCPTSQAKRQEKLKAVRAQLADLNMVLNQTQDHRQRVLHNVAKELPNWSIMVRKMKAIFHTMNLFNMDVSKKCLIGECWVPIADLGTVQNCLTEGSQASGSSIPSFLNVIHTDENPPTFNRTNRFTKGFQNLIDVYGVASYREANPALYTIITFPFLFGVMFGDAGHGLILTLFGAAMVLREKKIIAQKSDNEIWNLFFGGRYIILLMGLFSIYSGLIYNDIFAKSVNIFGSSWRAEFTLNDAVQNKTLELLPEEKAKHYLQEPYPMGLDPVWALAHNKIVFQNSFKMKLSIIFGVAHMIFGVCLNVVNIMYFKKYSSLFLEFIPQLFFLVFLFFYMTVLMFIKWILYNASSDDEGRRPGCAPSVLITFINMMLFKDAPVPAGCSQYMFEGQDILQKVLIFSALACIPVMLFGKPLFILCSSKFKAPGKVYSNGNASQDIELQPQEVQSAGTSSDAAGGHGSKDQGFGELMITQSIHTIEYVLSTVSHTASYLRLWALSLAHSQLSEVLWNRVLRQGLGAEEDQYVNSVILFVTFAVWAFFTVVILVLMEGLSAFLHTLRLHWVEFMTKFYMGIGYPFQPFYFKSILDAEDAEE
ncbi:V-type proton ATPase 116 kDa subunit a-like [Nylanderia fulva]|uniref:V-type proton ATPase 116 kDa subunit a-like n=1 Tax=Nylanderia fulva TaxID=613905 RepID=UPI0010FB2E89|nr:V-type proton ATPase 116 kDa subunit a-like [Nylanderia fulva]XP_029162436.1 V-type proton ATPase 116 kDa subunit a-like [Nylanderia fulva]XP_029162437.1 V-type proton ATPase 116 kDa subunit a-like [Nylanderia fulva]XP_029162438.1 V-type proton ATPase 116 kDa subunit a-like [Nylanderia fulva]XP_029162439.1 V-type proton ATPase 116 kDa subunit a-like [Nylanderia fulva]XP_029162440.1 V-type proton ATPase 116 kDa subunit a-like [Nylanderia fulva]